MGQSQPFRVDDFLVGTPEDHLHRLTYTRCRIDTINSPDDGHIAVRNMYRIEINIHGKDLCVNLVIYKGLCYFELFGIRKL